MPPEGAGVAPGAAPPCERLPAGTKAPPVGRAGSAAAAGVAWAALSDSRASLSWRCLAATSSARLRCFSACEHCCQASRHDVSWGWVDQNTLPQAGCCHSALVKWTWAGPPQASQVSSMCGMPAPPSGVHSPQPRASSAAPGAAPPPLPPVACRCASIADYMCVHWHLHNTACAAAAAQWLALRSSNSTLASC